MNKTPTIEELKEGRNYELLAVVDHARIKDFVLHQVMEDKKFIPYYMAYQTVLFLGALFFLSRAVALAFRGDFNYLIASIGALAFSLSFLIIIHELLHGIMLKLAGAPRISFGMVPGRFIFFVAADKFVLNRKSFMWVAFAPLVTVQIVTVLAIFLWAGEPLVYFPVMVMCVHSFFCAGDIALATLFYRYPEREVFTFDDAKGKTSYYYISGSEINPVSNSAAGKQ
jgi:hypothetical protein